MSVVFRHPYCKVRFIEEASPLACWHLYGVTAVAFGPPLLQLVFGVDHQAESWPR
jgi:hypothetical protein